MPNSNNACFDCLSLANKRRKFDKSITKIPFTPKQNRWQRPVQNSSVELVGQIITVRFVIAIQTQ